jgi:hypothetical protein
MLWRLLLVQAHLHAAIIKTFATAADDQPSEFIQLMRLRQPNGMTMTGGPMIPCPVSKPSSFHSKPPVGSWLNGLEWIRVDLGRVFPSSAQETLINTPVN